MIRRAVVRLPLAVVCLAGGVALGTATVLLHATGWGLVLGLAATLATQAALPGGWWSRLALAVGWTTAVVVLGSARAEGDYLVASNGWGYALLAGIPVVLVAGLVGVRHHRDPGVPQRPDPGVGAEQGPAPS